MTVKWALILLPSGWQVTHDLCELMAWLRDHIEVWGMTSSFVYSRDPVTDKTVIFTWPSRDQFRYAPSQWETSLHCNDVSHWLGACIDWSLALYQYRLVSYQHSCHRPLYSQGASKQVNIHQKYNSHIAHICWLKSEVWSKGCYLRSLKCKHLKTLCRKS